MIIKITSEDSVHIETLSKSMRIYLNSSVEQQQNQARPNEDEVEEAL